MSTTIDYITSAIYTRKADTKYSYYRQSGDNGLPSRIDLSLGNTFSQVAKKGRMLSGNVVGEIRGQFKVAEESPLKQFPPYKISSKIFRQSEFPQLIGWGDIAISNEEGETKNVEGIAIFLERGEDTIQIFFIDDDPFPSIIEDVCDYISYLVKKGEV